MKRRAAWLLLLAACSVAPHLAFAQPYPRPPEPGPPRPLALAAPQETTLANGLRVVVAARPGVPLVTAELVALVGAEADPDAQPGRAAFAAAVMTQGTAKRSAPALAAAAEALGGSLEAAAGWGQSTLGMTVTTPRLDAALGLIAEVARTPAFAPEEIERVRAQALDGLKVQYASAGTLAAWVSQRITYGAGAWGHPASGTPASVATLQRADLLAAHARTWRPDRTVLVLAGDVDLARATALATRHFASWRAATPDPASGGGPEVPDPTPADGPRAVVVDLPKAGQAAVVVSVPLPARNLDDLASADVLNAVLGGGYSSRLGSEIRIKRGLSYDASSGIGARRAHGQLQAVVQTKNETAAEVAKLIDEQLDRLVAEPVPADELRARKATLIGRFSRSVETTAGLAAAVRSLVVLGLPPAALTSRIGAYEAVDATQVQRYAARTLAPERRRLAIAGEAAAFAPALQGLQGARGPVETVPLDRLDLTRPDALVRR